MLELYDETEKIAFEKLKKLKEKLEPYDRDWYDIDNGHVSYLKTYGFKWKPEILKDFPYLKKLVMGGYKSKIKKISGLEHLTELNSLDIGGTNISKIEGLESLIKLESLILGTNKISKIEGLDNLSNLKKLALGDNKIAKIEGLDNLVELKTLWLSVNRIKKIEGLSNLINLDDLSLHRNFIKKIEGLNNLSSLRKLTLRGNNKKLDLKALYNVPSLELLILDENQINSNSKELRNLVKELPNLRISKVSIMISFRPEKGALEIGRFNYISEINAETQRNMIEEKTTDRKFCPWCGVSIDPNSKDHLCPNCGNLINFY